MFEEEYVNLVIKPKIDIILEAGVESLPDLTKKFNKIHKCSVSKSRITAWLKHLGYRVTRVVQINRPFQPAPPAPAPAPFQQSQRPTQFDRLPPPPAGMFANVTLPGQEY